MPQERSENHPTSDVDTADAITKDAEQADSERTREITIFVNMDPKTFTGRRISFEQVVQLTTGLAQGPDVIYTVTYSKGPEDQRTGSLVAGKDVRVKNGMVFSVATTIRS